MITVRTVYTLCNHILQISRTKMCNKIFLKNTSRLILSVNTINLEKNNKYIKTPDLKIILQRI